MKSKHAKKTWSRGVESKRLKTFGFSSASSSLALKKKVSRGGAIKPKEIFIHHRSPRPSSLSGVMSSLVHSNMERSDYDRSCSISSAYRKDHYSTSKKISLNEVEEIILKSLRNARKKRKKQQL